MGACWLRVGTAKHSASKADSAADRRTGVGKGTCMTSPQRKRLCTPASEGVRDEGKRFNRCWPAASRLRVNEERDHGREYTRSLAGDAPQGSSCILFRDPV